MRFESKKVVVTGAARGIGFEYARAFVREGAEVIMADVLADELVKSASELGDRATHRVVDVSDEQSVASFFEMLRETHGHIDALVNNAAIMLDVEKPFKPFWEIDVGEWDRVQEVNTKGVFLCCREARRLMASQGGGKIVNITSDAIWAGYTGQLAYFASKGAVAVMTRCIARELGEFGINVNAVAPGLTSSASVENSDFLQGVKGDIISQRALKRDQTPTDLVGTVLFLCSSESDAITGQTILVNSGGLMV